MPITSIYILDGTVYAGIERAGERAEKCREQPRGEAYIWRDSPRSKVGEERETSSVERRVSAPRLARSKPTKTTGKQNGIAIQEHRWPFRKAGQDPFEEFTPFGPVCGHFRRG